MLFRPLASLALAVSIGCLFAPQADANSRFTIVNQTDESMRVLIFNGADSACNAKLKGKNISSGETESFGCQGGGKHRCKIHLKSSGNRVCAKDRDTCSGYATRIANHGTITISSDPDGGYTCTFDE